MNKQSEGQYKTCSKCKEIKSISEFHKDKTSKDGLNHRCKNCQREANKKWSKVNPEKKKESNKKYYRTNHKRIKECNKRWREANPEKNKELWKKWYKVNSEKVKERSREWQKANREHHNIYNNNKKATDPLFKLKCDMSRSVKQLLGNQGYTKKSKIQEILGIEYNVFYEWLNGEASNGLNINVDETHLDHVIPTSLANTKEEVLMLNHYSNLQLLLAVDNLSKKNSYIYRSNLGRVLKYHPNPEILDNIVSRSKIKII